MKLGRLLIVICAMAALATSALAESLSWQIIGAGKFKVELYGVGDPYPSRQYITPQINAEWNASFANLTHRLYFVRVTNLINGQAKQTTSFEIADYSRAWIGMMWNRNYLVYSTRFIYFH